MKLTGGVLRIPIIGCCIIFNFFFVQAQDLPQEAQQQLENQTDAEQS